MTSAQNGGKIEEKKYLKIKDVEHLNQTLGKSEREFLSKVTEQEKMSINYYTSCGAEFLNVLLRNEEKSTFGKEQIMDIENLCSAISKYKLDTNIITYRVIPDGIVKDIKIGDIFTDKGFQSSTPLKFAVIEYANEQGFNSIFEISVPSKKNIGAYINSLSSYGKDIEYEFLLNKGLIFKVTDVYVDDDNKKIIKVVILNG